MSISFHSPFDLIWYKRGIQEELLSRKKDCFCLWWDGKTTQVFVSCPGKVGKLEDCFREIQVTVADERKFAGVEELCVPCLGVEDKKKIMRAKAREVSGVSTTETFFGLIQGEILLYDTELDEFSSLSQDFERVLIGWHHSPLLGGQPGKVVYVDTESQTVTLRDSPGSRVTLRSLASFDEKEKTEYKRVDDSQPFAWVKIEGGNPKQLDFQTECLFEYWYQTREMGEGWESEEYEYSSSGAWRGGAEEVFTLTRVADKDPSRMLFIQKRSFGGSDSGEGVQILRVKKRKVRIE